MAAAIVIVAIFIVVGISAVVSLRRRAPEVHDVEQHHRALGTLERFARERGLQADHQIGVPRSQQRAARDPTAPPVRLDLGRLADLTDPDMIRIEAPLASRSPAPPEASPARPPVEPDATSSSPASSAKGDSATEPSRALAGARAESLSAPSSDASSERVPPTGSLEETAALASVPGPTGQEATQVLATVAEPVAAVRRTEARTAAGDRRIYSLHRRSRLPIVIVSAGAVAVGIGIVAFALTSSKGSPAASAGGATSLPTSTASSTRRHHSGTGAGSGQRRSNQSHAATATSTSTTSSSGRPHAITLVGQSAQQATYQVQGGVHTVVLQVSNAPCWVGDGTTPGGALLWDSTLPAGGSYTISWSGGPLWLRMGNSAVLSVTVNGHPVRFTAPPGVFNLYFEPATTAG
jgi:hypothetical protein